MFRLGLDANRIKNRKSCSIEENKKTVAPRQYLSISFGSPVTLSSIAGCNIKKERHSSYETSNELS